MRLEAFKSFNIIIVIGLVFILLNYEKENQRDSNYQDEQADAGDTFSTRKAKPLTRPSFNCTDMHRSSIIVFRTRYKNLSSVMYLQCFVLRLVKLNSFKSIKIKTKYDLAIPYELRVFYLRANRNYNSIIHEMIFNHRLDSERRNNFTFGIDRILPF